MQVDEDEAVTFVEVEGFRCGLDHFNRKCMLFRSLVAVLFNWQQDL